MMMDGYYDILIIGAGVAGCAAAIAVKKQLPDCSVCLIERSLESRSAALKTDPIIGETLPSQVVLPMQQLGIWEQFQQLELMCSSGSLACWGNEAPNTNESLFSAYGGGWHIDRNQFNEALLTFVSEVDVDVFYGVEVSRIEKNSCWQVTLRDLQKTKKATGLRENQVVECNVTNSRFLIDATGRTANIASKLGVKKQRLDNLVGIYQYYKTSRTLGRNADSTIMIEAMKYGWWYSAALPSGLRVVTLMTDADYARGSKCKSPQQFTDALMGTRFLSQHVDFGEALATPKVSAAHTQRLDKIAGHGWLATGDAAFTFDPLSSLGLFKALRMATIASYAVNDYFRHRDTELEKYQWFGNSEFENYLVKKSEYYAQEIRFPEQEFWQRRRAA